MRSLERLALVGALAAAVTISGTLNARVKDLAQQRDIYQSRAANWEQDALNWQTEAIAVKQSIGVLIAMFGGWVIAAVLGIAYYLLYAVIGSTLFLCIAVVLLALLSALELKWINTRGSEIFRYL